MSDDVNHLSPRQLQGQEAYDKVVEILKNACPPVCCNECAFDIPEEEECARECMQTMLAGMRGHKGGDA